MNLALNNLQRLICHKTQTTNKPPPIIPTSQTYHTHTTNKKNYFLYNAMIICSFVKKSSSPHTHTHTTLIHTLTHDIANTNIYCNVLTQYIHYIFHTQS